MRPRQFTDAELYATARELILEHGPSIPAQRIADALGVSAAALFKRVGTKHELVRRALIGSDRPDICDVLPRAPDERPIRVQLLEIATQIDDFLAELIPTMTMLKAGGICSEEVFEGEDVPPPIRTVRALQAWLETSREQGRVAFADSEPIAVAFLGAIQARHSIRAFLAAYPDGGPNYIEVLVDTLLAALAPKESQP